jgi:hypothetical protein
VLSVVIFVLVSPMMAETPSGSVYSVGRDQIVVSSSIPPANAEKWATPTLSHSKLSAQGAGILAVGWAGGLSTRVPGGFYNASNVRIVSVQHQNGPVPYYLVRLTGQIGRLGRPCMPLYWRMDASLGRRLWAEHHRRRVPHTGNPTDDIVPKTLNFRRKCQVPSSSLDCLATL